MVSFFFLLLYFSFIFFWFYLLKYSGVEILRISIPSFLIISIFVYQYLGYPILFFFLNDYRAELTPNRNIILQIFLLSSLTITLIILGFIFAKKIFGPIHLKNQYNSFSKIFFFDNQLSRVILYLVFILSLLVLFIYLYKVGINNIALLSTINLIENSFSTKVLRSNMGNAFDGKYHWYRLFMRDFLSIASVAFFGLYILRKKLTYFIIFTFSFCICLFSMTMATEKAPVMWYIISLILIYFIIKKNGKFELNHIFFFSFFGFLLIALIYKYFMNSPNIIIGFTNALSRITAGQLQPLYYHIEFFPFYNDFLWGRSFPNPGGFMSYEHFSISKELFSFIFPDKVKSGIVGSLPTFYWGEMYANFGYLGVIIPPFFIGFLLYGLNVLIFRFPMTPFKISIYIWIILHYKGLAGKSLSGFIIDYKLFFVIILFILSFSANRFKIKYFKHRKY